MKARNPNVGRRAMGANPAPGSGIKPPGTNASAGKDSGGKIFNPEQKPKSNSNAAALTVNRQANSSSYPGMNTAATNTPLNAVGSGKVTKKVAVANPRFYGK